MHSRFRGVARTSRTFRGTATCRPRMLPAINKQTHATRTARFPNGFQPARGQHSPNAFRTRIPRRHRRSRRALCRTRTDDPFLTMERSGRHERARTGTRGQEIPAVTHFRVARSCPHMTTVAHPELRQGYATMHGAPSATLPLVTGYHPDIVQHRQDDPGRRRPTVCTRVVPDGPLTGLPEPRNALGDRTRVVACRPPSR